MKYSPLVFSIIVFIHISCSGLFAQPDTSDYNRADNLIKLTTGKVFYDNVKPTWINSTGKFLYESNTPTGIKYFIIDATDQSKSFAFNQERFAEALGNISGQKMDPGKLPVRNLVFSESLRSFSFIYDNFNWICNLRNYRLIKGDRIVEGTGSEFPDWGFRDELAHAPVESPDKRWTAFIKNYNVYIRSSLDKKEYQLSYEGGTGEYYSSYFIWSPDSKKLISSRIRPVEKHMIHYIESSPEDQIQPKHYSYAYKKPGDAIPQMYPQLFDIEKK